MLTAKKNIWFERLFSFYNRNLIKRRFSSLRISNLSEISNCNKLLPLIIYLNHSSWWDGLIAFETSRQARLQSYIMMDEIQLKKLFFFRRLGAFSVNKESPQKAFRSINYASEILKQNSSNVLWIFPQGDILPNDIRPLYFYNGLSSIVKKLDEEVQLLPVAIAYEFLNKFKPEIFIKIGKVELISPNKHFDKKKHTKEFSFNLTRLLDELKSNIINRDFAEFSNLI